MLKDIFVGVARQNILVDLALNIVETLTYETRMAGVCLAVTGAGIALTLCSLLAVVLSSGHWASLIALGLGIAIAGAAGWRLYVAKERIKALKDAITAKAARDAAANVVNKGVELARAGADQVAKVGSTIAGAGRHATQAGLDAASSLADAAAGAGRQASQAGLDAASSVRDAASRVFSRKN